MIGRRGRRNGTRPEVPPAPAITTYAEALASLRALGFEAAICGPLCRRKTEHQHMTHGSGTAELIVSPASAQ